MKANRMMSLFLSVALILTLLSPGMTARAATDDENWADDSTVTLATGKTYTMSNNRPVNLVVPAGATVGLNGNGYTLTGTLTLNGGSTVTINNLNITSKDAGTSTPSAIKVAGTGVALTVHGDNTITAGHEDSSQAAVHVPDGSALTISGDGVLTVNGSRYAAAIGGNRTQNSGSITINSGTVNANAHGLGYGAAIGGGESGNGGTIRITGGIVNATSDSGAAIGGGGGSDGGGTGGNIEISGGKVTATSSSGAAIGGGGGSASGAGGDGGTIKITGGEVTATATDYGAAIGGGGNAFLGADFSAHGGKGATLTISGGTVTAINTYSDSRTVAIGSGASYKLGIQANAEGSATITGGNIYGRSQGKTTPFRTTGFATNGTSPVYLVTAQTSTSVTFLPGATVTVSGAYPDVVTNEEGKAYLWLPVGSYNFDMTKAPNSATVSSFTVAANDTNTVELKDSDNLPPPILTAGPVWRTGNATAYVTFTSDQPGTYWYKAVNAGFLQPSIDTTSGGTACVAGENTISVTGLTPGAMDIYIIVKNSENQLSDAAFHIPMPAFFTEASWPDDGTGIMLINGTNITFTKDHTQELVVDANATVTIDGDNYKLTGTLELRAGSTVNITNLNIDMANYSTPAIRVTGTGVTINFTGSNTMTPVSGGTSAAAAATVEVPYRTALTLSGTTDDAEFISSAPGRGAAIGGVGKDAGESSSSGSVTITSGTVTATANGAGAAIGGGFRGNGSTIAITGGTVTASANSTGAAIGGGYYGDSGTINISGNATVTATATATGAAIGGGYMRAGGIINISGNATVTATATGTGAAIGGSGDSTGGTGATVTISGAPSVIATSAMAAGIGGGNHAPANGHGSATITGGSVSGASYTGQSPFLTAGFAKNGIGATIYQTAVTVQDSSGDPVEGATVTVDGTYAATTSASGVACVWLSAGAHDFTAAKDATTIITQNGVSISPDDQNVLLLTNATKPLLQAERAFRFDATAEVTFTSSAAGEYYYAVVEKDATAPTIDTSGAGTACAAGRNTINLSGLADAAQDLYIVVKNGVEVSNPLKIELPAKGDDTHWPDDSTAITLPAGAELTLTKDHLHSLVVPAGAEVWIDGGGATLTGQLVLGSGSTVHIKDLNITMPRGDLSAIRVLGMGNKLLLGGSSVITGLYGSSAATIAVPVGTELTIDDDAGVDGDGAIKVDSQMKNLGATIGGDAFVAGGTINILGGKIEAYSAFYGAVIGGGQGASGGTLNISGGTVGAKFDKKSDAHESLGGAVFGGGYNNNGPGGDGGIVNISGGTVSVTTVYGTGIGGGNNFSGAGAGGAGAALTITGGWVYVSGGEWGGGTDYYDIGQSRSSLVGTPGSTVITGGSLTTAKMDASRITGWQGETRYPVTVTVSKASGPVAGVEIVPTGSDYTNPVITGDDGKATFWLPNGDYTFSATQGVLMGSAAVTVNSGHETATISLTTDVTFTAEQEGGALHDTTTTGIKLTFGKAVTGLTADKITIGSGTGAATKGTLSGSGNEWTIALESVTTEGDVTVSIANFDDYVVTSEPQTVPVYKQIARVATTVKIYTDEDCTVEVTADILAISLSKQYYAATFDQFGNEMSDTHTWNLTGITNVTQINGNVIALPGAADGATGTLTAKSVADNTVTANVAITVRNITVNWNIIEPGDAITYGDSKASAFTTLPTTGTATVPGEGILSGTFAIENPDVILAAGTQTVAVVFTVTTEGAYKGLQFTKHYTVTVKAKAITVTVTPVSREYGAENPTFEATAAAGVLVGGDTITSLNLNLTTAADTDSDAGSYAVTGESNGNPNYTVTVAANTAFTITPAALTLTGTPGFGPILANHDDNASKEALLTAVQASANSTLSASYANGTSNLNATWAWGAEAFNPKGGTYTLVATLTPANTTNFTYSGANASVSVTVTAVTGTFTYSPTTLIKSMVDIGNASAMSDLGLPTQITVDYDNGVADGTCNITAWSPTLQTLQGIDATNADVLQNLVPTVDFPAWATITSAEQAKLKTELTITAKFPVTVTVAKPGDITYGAAVVVPEPSQAQINGNGTEASPTWSYHYQGTTRGGAVYSSETAPTAAGTYTVTATLESDTHSGSGTSAEFTIAPKALANGMITVSDSYTYTGSPIAPSFTVTDSDLMTNSDYTAAVTNNLNAGTAVITVTASASGNYTGTATANFTIAKADAPTVGAVLKNHPVSQAGSGTIDLAALLPTDRGTTSFAFDGLNTGGAVASSSIGASDGQFAYTTTSASTDESTDISVVATMQNYANATITITVALVSKTIPTGTPQVSGTLTFGQTLSELGISVSMTDGGTPVPGSISWVTPSVKPVVGAAPQPWTFTPDDTATYAEVTGTAAITVNKATPAGTPTMTAITQSGKTLTDAGLTGSFTNPHDGTVLVGTLTWNDGDGTAVTANTAYGWTFAPGDTDNYNERTGTLTPYTVSGGGSPTPTPPPSTVEVSINGVPVTARVGADGTLTLTYTAADLEQYESDDGVFSINVGGMESTVLNLPVEALGANDLELETEFGTIVIPNETLAAIRELCGDTIRLVIEKGSFRVKLLNAEGKETAYHDPAKPFVITLPYTPNEGESPLAIVAIHVDSGAILPYAVFRDGEARFEISATGTYDLLYNGTLFSDVDGHWAAEDIEFVSARALFEGVGDGLFAPDTTMSRAMVTRVLANLCGADTSAYTGSRFTDVAVGAWYTPAIEWAAETGIVSGEGGGLFAPERMVTRAELATMLYRYVQFTGGGFTGEWVFPLDFADSANIPDWAREAASWLTMQGIVHGKQGGVFDPDGNAGRAEAAAMLRRLLER